MSKAPSPGAYQSTALIDTGWRALLGAGAQADYLEGEIEP